MFVGEATVPLSNALPSASTQERTFSELRWEHTRYQAMQLSNQQLVSSH